MTNKNKEKLMESYTEIENGTSNDLMTLNSNIKLNRGSYFFALFIVGTLNNNAYTLVQAAATDLAEAFGQQ